jgi:hypothetical protein
VPTGSVYSYGYSSQFHRNIQIGQYASEGGVYRCTSTNTLGTAEDNVTVNVKPVSHLSISPRIVQIGDKVEIRCRGFGYPPPNVSVSTPNSSVHFMASSEFVLNVAVGNLAEEGGIYSCNSLNRYGTATETTTLNVRIGVKCKPKSQTGRRGEAVYINCTVFGYPLPSQIYVTLPNGRNLSFPVSLRKSSFNHTLKVKISPSAEGGGLYVFRSKSTSGLAKAISSVLGMFIYMQTLKI